MINTAGSLLTAWYDLLKTSVGVSVYKENAPADEQENYVVLRVEGGVATNNKRSFADEVIVIVDIVTFFQNDVDRSVAEGIDNLICGLVLPTHQNGLTNPTNIQIVNVKRDGFEYLQETAERKIFRKISRWYHLVYQTI